MEQAKPAAPATTSGVQDGSYGPICIQASTKSPQTPGPGPSSAIGQAANQSLGGVTIPTITSASEGERQHDVVV